MATKSKTAAKSAKSAAAELSGQSAVVVGKPAGALALPPGVKIKRVVTVPSLALKNVGDSRILQFLDGLRVSKVTDKESKREPATVATVADMTTGEQFIFICPAVVKANLERDYADINPDGTPGYVGRAFYIENLGKRTESQRYNDYRIAEVEPE